MNMQEQSKSIPERIQEIISIREKERLPIIQKKKVFIGSVSQTIQKLKDFKKTLLEQVQLGTGNLLPLIEHAPNVANTIKELDLVGITRRIEKLEKELLRLEKRFSRKSIQIALIGYARRGKSKFLQSVAGLGDDVIPTSSSTDCTGAISIIENYDGPFQMDVEYYTLDEFLRSVSQSLTEILGSNVVIRSLDELAAYKNDVRLKSSEDNKVSTFYNDYVKGVDNYKDCFSNNAPQLFKEKLHVIEYVAKYRLFKDGETIPESYNCYEKEIEGNITKVLFNKFVAVKSAYIKTKYPYDKCGRIVMADTIGLGNKYTGEADKEKMYEVLINETDAAIFNILIPREGVNELPKVDSDVLDEVYMHLKDYCPEKWVSLNINHWGRKGFDSEAEYNIHIGAVKKVYNKAQNEKFGNIGEKKPLAYTMYVDNSDEDDVRENMLIPVLNNIKDNIDEIDQTFMVEADKMSRALYYEYSSICESIGKSIAKIKTSNPNFVMTFLTLYKALPLRSALKLYVDELYKNKDKVCDEIILDIKPQIDSIMKFAPSQNDIRNMILSMDGGHLDVVYHRFCDDVVAKILSSFKLVSASAIMRIQEKVQMKIASILYNEGKLGCLRLKTGSNAEPSVQWMRTFCNEKLSGHGVLSSAFMSILNFHMNIEGFLYAKCITACQKLNNHHGIEFPGNYTADEGAEFIWQEIRASVSSLKSDLYSVFGIDEGVRLFEKNEMLEASMPNLLVWCMVDTFMKELVNTNDNEDLKRFYSEYAAVIWQTEFQMQDVLHDATEGVINLSKDLNANCNQSYFTLI